MPALSNPRHEKFCHLIAAGKTYTEAYKTLYPNSNTAPQSGYGLYHRPDIAERVQEFRDEVAMRSIMDLSRKREVLRQMAEGIIPTKKYNKETGDTYDALAALLADAKIAGEFAPEKLQINSANDLKLLFNVPHRDVIDAEIVELPKGALGAGDPTQPEPSGEVSKNDQIDPLTSDNVEDKDQ
jgi:hypothetical protein